MYKKRQGGIIYITCSSSMFLKVQESSTFHNMSKKVQEMLEVPLFLETPIYFPGGFHIPDIRFKFLFFFVTEIAQTAPKFCR